MLNRLFVSHIATTQCPVQATNIALRHYIRKTNHDT